MPASLTVDDLEEATRSLSLAELDRLLEHLVVLRARRRAPVLPRTEEELLEAMEGCIPRDLLPARDRLVALSHRRALRGPERDELLRLTNAIETAEAERIGFLARLAQLRGVSVEAVAEQLGLPRP